MSHIGDNAELYALGTLDEAERGRIEDHVWNCVPCMKLVGNAERIVSDIEAELPTMEPPRRLEDRLFRSVRALEQPVPARRPRYWAYAALFLVGLLATIMGARLWQADRQLRQTGANLTALSSGAFGHISFHSKGASEPIASAICEKHGNWIYLIVAKGDSGLTLYGERNGQREALGRPVNQGQIATLFIDKPGKFSALELVAAGQVVARARTHYPQ